MAITSSSPSVRPLRVQRRKPRYRSHAFFLTILIFCAFALFSHIAIGSNRKQEHAYHTHDKVVRPRELGSLASTDETCRLVRQSKDQCAYIAKHCPDEDAGFYTYIALYYCTLSHAKPVAFVILVSWLGLLFSTIGIAASDFFCINLSTIATILGMSESLAGVTFLAFGNGSPDVFSTFAAFATDSSSLAIGELFGAACFIAAVVAGSMGVVRPFKVAKKAYIRDVIFFFIAAVFSLACMWDGKLQVWECLAMVGYYILYVVVVVVWHWWFTRRRSRNDRIAAARGQYVLYVTDEDQEEYHDEPDEDGTSRPTLSHGTSADSFSLLEGAGLDGHEDSEDDDEERDRVMANLQSNMHLNRAPPRSRRSSITPIRPSLVGALEYRALVSTLQRARTQQTIPMSPRQYPHDNAHVRLDADNLSTISDPQYRPPYYLSSPRDERSPLLERPTPEVRSTPSGRSRAVSANDAATFKPDPRFMERHAISDRNYLDVSTDGQGRLRPPSPSLASNPFDDQAGSRPSFNLLAPPAEGAHPITPPRSPHYVSPHQSPHPSPRLSPHLSPRPSTTVLPKLHIPDDSKSSQGSAPSSPFPAYNDSFTGSRPSSIYLPPPSVSPGAHSFLQLGDDVWAEHPLKWWPYSILPSPIALIYRLFPTFQHWHAKSWWERVLAIVAAPSILLLTITLPVVDSEPEENGEVVLTTAAGNDPPFDAAKSTMIPGSPQTPTSPGHGSAAVATSIERALNPTGPARTPSDPVASSPQPWDRWLTITQLFLAPLFIVIVLETQYLDPPDGFQPLIKPICISLLVSLVLLVPLLLTTTTTHRPKAYETILSLAGFAVAIGWISSIASQVVAVLKALAVILNMSHAVMGLTIFAVGNSLGDLVADVTVAKLGYPVMALSACFGGPMLNILLGIGLSGSWILIRGAEHRHQKHPGEDFKFRSYDIEVGTTLMISGITLVFTLLVLAVAVPCNQWMMSKKLGWGLIALWTISTLGNVLVVEIFGLGQSLGEA
ncbi:Sodium/calcium exchanger protein-domain-containing protein [Delphinella strobiligena]|nr:Sodium/calcium exchanger protein-domain-containing protein [Delphinella strobiligena]